MSNLAENLDEFLDERAAAEPEEQRFTIDTEEKADWAIRKIVKLQKKIDDAKRLANERKQQIEEWLESIESENQRSIEHFQAIIRPWAEQQLDGKKKTVKLPSGTVSFRKSQPKFFIGGVNVDKKNSVLLEYVKQNAPTFVKVEETADWTKFKETLIVTESGAVITQDGEVLTFMAALEQPDTISVKG